MRPGQRKLAGQEVTVAGWVHRRRDHGGVIFVDLRDREGLLQVVFDPDDPTLFAEAERLRSEFVIQVRGLVRARPAGTANANLASGKVEVLARALTVLNHSEPLPFQLDEQVGEEMRLRYRYIDLRREEMSQRLRLRHRMTSAMRRYMDEHGFIDIETPMLTKATPEGARDYLVPSRTHPGSFFALPQSPQIFKQLLMVAGFDRYYQIVRCFRDEDLRADRQPEFTQLDIETSFLDAGRDHGPDGRPDPRPVREGLEVALPKPFPAHDLRGGHAPLRFRQAGPARPAGAGRRGRSGRRLRLQGIRRTRQRIPKGRVAALRAPGGGAFSRSEIDDYTTFVARYGAKGLAYIKVNERAKGREGLQSPIVKFLDDDRRGGHPRAHRRAGRRPHVLRCRQAKVVSDALGALRLKIGHDLKLVQHGLAATVGGRFPDVRVRRGREALGGHAPSVHRAEGRRSRGAAARARARPWPRPTTWC